jgi:hypothetical protein
METKILPIISYVLGATLLGLASHQPNLTRRIYPFAFLEKISCL